MAGLSRCMSIVSRMSEADASALIERVDANVAAGMAPAAAQRAAVDSMLADIAREEDELKPLFARRITASGRGRSTNDAVVPETPEFDGERSGDLAMLPAVPKHGIASLPIRVSAGIAREAHRGFGLEHIHDNAKRFGREPLKATDDPAENAVRQVAAVARSARELYQDQGRLILRDPGSKTALILEERDGPLGSYWSVVSWLPAPRPEKWGQPVWRGRMPPMGGEVEADEALLDIARADSAASPHRLDIASDAQGVIPGALRTLDRSILRGEYSLADVSAGFERTRAELRRRYGDKLTLYRADAPQAERNPDTLTVYMGDRAMAERFTQQGREAAPFTVSTADVVAVYATPSGYYEFIVRRPRTTSERFTFDDEPARARPRPLVTVKVRRAIERAEAELPSAMFSRAPVTKTPEFRKWFGASVVVNEDGSPKVVYHGTTADFDTFDAGKAPQGFHFGTARAASERFDSLGNGDADYVRPEGGDRIMPIYLSIENPLRVEDYGGDTYRWQDAAIRAAAKGHDGLVYANEYEDKGADSYVAFRPEQIKSAFNIGTFDPANPDIRFSRATLEDDIAGQAAYLEAEAAKRGHASVDEFVDADYEGFAAAAAQWRAEHPAEALFKRQTQQAATWASPQTSWLDSFIYEAQDKQVDLKRVVQGIRDSGAALRDRQDAYLREELYHGRVAARSERFIEREVEPLLKAMKAAGVSQEALEEYLYARHAQERNAEMKLRNPGMANNDALSGMSDADAQLLLAQASPAMATLAQRVDAIIEATRDLMVVAGLEKQGTIDGFRQTWAHYVPLHRDDATEGGRPSTGSGFSVRGKSFKQALGSNKAATNILAHILLEREAVITRAEKNVVAMSVYSLALNHPNPDFWRADAPQSKRMLADDGTVQTVADQSYKSKDNVLVVRVNGEDRIVEFNADNDRALRMAQALKNLDTNDIDAITNIVSKGTRWLASVNTQYNPVFGLVNATRDLQGAMVNLTDTPINGAQAAVLRDAPRAFAALWRAHGNAAAAGPWVDIVREFKSRGGMTGWKDTYADANDRNKALEREIRRLSQGKLAALGSGALDTLSTFNEAIENALRVATYKAGLDRGLTKDQAASVAKNLTVNFNRKGRTGAYLGRWYAFLNAGIQGNARTLAVLTGKHGPKVIAGGLALGVLQALLLASMDDEAEELIPEWERERNFIIPTGGASYIKIPLSLGLHVLPNIGRAFAEMAVAGYQGKRLEPGRKLTALLSTLFDAASPLGGAPDALQWVSPTVFDPVVQLITNRDFTGKPVYQERRENDTAKPGYTMARNTTAPGWRLAAQGINAVSGGDAAGRNTDLPGAFSPQPEAVRFVFETLGGGVWRETEKLIDGAYAAVKGPDVEVPPERMLVVGRFYGSTDNPQSPSGVFYDNAAQLQALARRVKRLEEAGDDKGLERLLKRYPEAELAVGKGSALARARKADGAYRDAIRELYAEDAPETRIKELELERSKAQREFNALVREAKK